MHRCVVAGLPIGGDAPVALMGVINCSPESFFSGSYTPAGMVHERAWAMVDEGADIIDIGARSTAPGSPPISEAEEVSRMEQALSALDGSGIRVSVDTVRPAVLEACLAHDIAAANDISGLCDPAYARLVGEAGIPAFLMASFKSPGDARSLDETCQALARVVNRSREAGVASYVLDPGIGLWTPERTPGLDWEICRHFSEFTVFDRPLLAAISRKTFLGSLVEKPPEGRLPASLSLTALLVAKGASAVRTHDVAATRDAVRVAEAAWRRA